MFLVDNSQRCLHWTGDNGGVALSWKERIQIAVHSAQGFDIDALMRIFISKFSLLILSDLSYLCRVGLSSQQLRASDNPS